MDGKARKGRKAGETEGRDRRKKGGLKKFEKTKWEQ